METLFLSLIIFLISIIIREKHVKNNDMVDLEDFYDPEQDFSKNINNERFGKNLILLKYLIVKI